MIRDDIDKLRDGQHIVVGTPGRILPMVQKRHLRVDEMMSRGFRDVIADIFKCLPPTVQVCLLSATMTAELLEVTTMSKRDAVHIHVTKGDGWTLEGVRQFYVAIEKEEWKLDTVCDLYDCLGLSQLSIIYCNTRRKLDFLTDQLTRRDFRISAIHAELDQKECDLVLRECCGSPRVLISTDRLDCGVGELEAPLVINYDLPSNAENYLHRIGRRGGVPQTRVAINFVTNNDVQIMRDLQKVHQIDEMPMDIADLI